MIRQRLSTRSATVAVTAVSAAAAACILGGLSLQMAAGNDPALGSGLAGTATDTSPAQRSVQAPGYQPDGYQPSTQAPAYTPAPVVTRTS